MAYAVSMPLEAAHSASEVTTLRRYTNLFIIIIIIIIDGEKHNSFIIIIIIFRSCIGRMPVDRSSCVVELK